MISAPKTVPGYILAFLAGGALLAVASPFVRSQMVSRQIDRAGRSLERGDAIEALDLVRRWEGWAAAFPPLDLEMRGRKTACLADLRRWEEAEKLAAGIRFGERSPSPGGLLHLLQGPGISMVNSLLVRRAKREGVTKWLGYEALVPEWAARGDRRRIEAFAAELHGRKVSSKLQAALDLYTGATAGEIVQRTPTRETVAPAKSAKPTKPLLSAPAISPPVAVSTKGSRPSWGVVRAVKAGVYDRKGKLIAKARAGTIVDVREKKRTKAGLVLVCRILENKADKTKDYVLRARDVEVRVGSYGKAGEKEKSLTIEVAELQAEIQASERVSVESDALDNPHRAAYLQAKKAYDRFWQKVKALEKQRDSATGDKRVAALDGLRELKGEDVRLGREFETVKSRYDAWNRTRSGPASANESAETKTLRRRLAKARQELASVGAGR